MEEHVYRRTCLATCPSMSPSPFPTVHTYLDQVTTYFDWGDVHRADRCLEDLERLVNASQAE